MAALARFELPPWPAGTAEEWEGLRRRAHAIASNVGTTRQFRDDLEVVRGLIDRQDFDGLHERLPSARFARAVASVWAQDAERAWASMDPYLVWALVGARSGAPSRLLLLTMAEVFFTYFDQLDQPRPGVIDALRQSLIEGMRRRVEQHGSQLSGALGAVMARTHQLLHPAQLPALAREIEASGVSLHEWLHRSRLDIFDVGRFRVRLRQETYLRQIATADPTQPAGLDFLADLTDQNVYRAPGADGWFFGHQVVAALALQPASPPCDQWMQTMLTIAGDPRLKQTASWRTWWEPLGEQVQRAAIRWLSREDLELFLDAIEQFGEEDYRDDIKRMFPARSAFLRGLYQSNLIVETRLVLGDRVRTGVQRHLGNHRADLSRLSNDPGLAVIIVDCGSFYFVEGSHNFKWGIFAGRTPDRLLDRSVRSYTRTELYEQVVYEHDTRHPLGVHAREWRTHQGYWAVRAWRFLVEGLGIDLDGRVVLDDATYRWAKYSPEGMPVLGHRLVR